MTRDMTTLGELISLQRGYDLPEAQRSLGPIPVVGSAGVTGYHDSARAKGPGVTIGRSGASFGKVFYVREDYWPHNAALFVTDFKGSEPLFIRYLLESIDFSSLNSGSAQQSLNRNYVYGISVVSLPLPVQRWVAGILSAYDELIENNQRRIRILEEMARALYREWFVEFRFLGNEKVPSVASTLGEIPKGWEVKRLEAVCRSVQDGDWIETKDQGGEDYRLVQISNIGVGEFVETGNLRFITEETFARLRCNEILPGDILVARMPTPIGRAWLATTMPWRMITAVDVAIVRTHPTLVHPIFLSAAWNESANLQRIAAQASGTTRPRVTRRELVALEFLIPPIGLQSQFAQFIAPQMKMIQALRLENKNLRGTRDVLLPRLLSGRYMVGV